MRTLLLSGGVLFGCAVYTFAAFDGVKESEPGTENNFFCEPAIDGLSCTGQCGDPAIEFCAAQEILADAQGNFLQVTCCACIPKQCHVTINPASFEFSCRSSCPNQDLDCALIGHGNTDGTITYSCECIDPNEPVGCEYVEECNANCPGSCVHRCTGVCPEEEEVCLPDRIVESPPLSGNFTVSDCECDVPATDLCRPVIQDNAVQCIGKCPDPAEQCELVVTDVPNGVEYTCEPCASDEPIGACCYEDAAGGVFCVHATLVECDTIYNGNYLGDGTNCNVHGYLCDQMGGPEGACCYLDGAGVMQCTVTTQANCEDVLVGQYQGNFTTCVPDPCEDVVFTGACCYTDNLGRPQCTQATAEECGEDLAGSYLGDNTDCDPNPCTEEECGCVGDCLDATPQYTAPAYNIFTGEVAVVTNAADLPNETVLVHIDIKNRNTAPLGVNWNTATTTRYSHPSWTQANLGAIFGVALDRRGHTYVTTTTCYYNDALGIGTWGSVYQIHATTGAISVFANLPNTGPGLGNITYDGARDQFFVTNHEDGRIYRLDNTGACLGTFDHATGTISASCAPEGGDPAGFVPLGERIWGVGVYNNRVYYGAWNEDQGQPDPNGKNEVWSIALSGGTFSGAAQLEIKVPDLTFFDWSMPIADISFSETGCMLLAERSMINDTSPSAHLSRVLEYRLSNTNTWWPSAYTFGIGEISFGSINAAGGVDYDREGNVWATGDALSFSPLTIYGLQSLPCTGGLVTNSVLVDIDAIYDTLDKTEIGDVEVACAKRCIQPPKGMFGWWPLDEQVGTVAQDISWGNNGTYVGTTPIPGVVGGARNFNGAGQYIRVPDHPAIDFDVFDFSVDAWVRTTDAVGVDVIAEKRESPGSPRGWSLYLFNGRLSAQLGDGAFSNYGSTLFVADGLWHFVTMTVDRDNPAGLLLYVDGVSQAFNPTTRSGSVSTATNLWIGSREPLFGQTFFRGDIDEVEVFRRVLAASEVQALYAAGKGGKCKDRCMLPANSLFCKNVQQITVNLTICNDSPASQTFFWFVNGNNNCNIAGPTVFSPGFGFVNVPGNGCLNVPIAITKPAGLVAPLVACYDVSVFNMNTGHFFRCQGSVKGSPFWCFGPIDWDPAPNGGILVGHARTIGFDVTNTESPDPTLAYEIHAVPHGGGDGTPPALSLDGLPPGEPVFGSLAIAQGTTGKIEVSVQALEHDPFESYDLLLSMDSDNDGTLEPHFSLGVFSELPCGDYDHSGEVDLPDASILATCLGGPGVEPTNRCPEDVTADCDNDLDADLADYAKVQNSFGLSTRP